MLSITKKFTTKELTEATGYSPRTLSRLIAKNYLVEGVHYTNKTDSKFSKTTFTLDGYFKVLQKKYGIRFNLSVKYGKYVVLVRYYNTEFVYNTRIKDKKSNRQYALVAMNGLRNMVDLGLITGLIHSGHLQRTGRASSFLKSNNIGMLLDYYLLDIKGKYDKGVIKKGTFERYLRACNYLKSTHLVHTNLNQLTREDVANLVSTMSLTYTGKTIRSYIKPLKDISSMLQHAGIIKINLFSNINYPQYTAPDPAFLTAQKKKSLKRLLFKNKSNLRLLIALYMETEANILQLINLKWEDIDMNMRQIYFNKNIPLNLAASDEQMPEAIDIKIEFMRYIRFEFKQQGKPSSGFVFKNSLGYQYLRKKLNSEFKKLLNLQGLESVNLISCKYTSIAKDLLASKGSEYIKSKYGYKSFFTVNRVIRILKSDIGLQLIHEDSLYTVRSVCNLLPDETFDFEPVLL